MSRIIKKIVKKILSLFNIGIYRLTRRAFIVSENPAYRKMSCLNSCFDNLVDNPWKNFSQDLINKFTTPLKMDNLKREHKIAIEIIGKLKIPKAKILGIGCGVGRYEEIFKMSGLDIEYHGCDISKEFIEVAKRRFNEHPEKFSVQDATNLSYEDNSFDVVMIEGVLQYIKDYKKCIKEAVRIAKDYIIFHRVTVVHEISTCYYRRKICGRIIPEIHFNESELVNDISCLGLIVLNIYTNKVSHVSGGVMKYVKSYLCRILP